MISCIASNIHNTGVKANLAKIDIFLTNALIIADNIPLMNNSTVILGRLMFCINLTIAANIRAISLSKSGTQRYDKKKAY